MPLIETRYVVFRGEIIELRREGATGLWRSKDGTVWALKDTAASVDKSDNCGVGIFDAPDWFPLNDDCKPHDFAYSSREYQSFHTRKEADEYLKHLIENSPSPWRVLARPFYWLSRLFGAALWENKDTND